MFDKEKYKYLAFLTELNCIYFPDDNYGFGNLRLTEPDEFQFVDDILNNFFREIKEENDENIIMKKLLDTVGRIWCFQPFLDGNTRTILTFISMFYKLKGYNITFKRDENGMFINNVIPLFYYLSEECSECDIQKLKRELKKSE